MTTTAQTTTRHGHPVDDRATAGVFAAQHLIYLLPVVILFLTLRASGRTPSGEPERG